MVVLTAIGLYPIVLANPAGKREFLCPTVPTSPGIELLGHHFGHDFILGPITVAKGMECSDWPGLCCIFIPHLNYMH